MKMEKDKENGKEIPLTQRISKRDRELKGSLTSAYVSS